jgi:hypothetical protein
VHSIIKKLTEVREEEDMDDLSLPDSNRVFLQDQTPSGEEQPFPQTYPSCYDNTAAYSTIPNSSLQYPGLPSNSMALQCPLGNQTPYPNVPSNQILPSYSYGDPGTTYSPEANTLIDNNGCPNTSFINSKTKGYYEVALNCQNNEEDTRKSRPFRCIAEGHNHPLLVMTPSKKNGDKKNVEEKVLSIWTKHKLPPEARLRWLVMRKGEQEAHKPVHMCPTHNEDGWGQWMLKNIPQIFFFPLTLQDGKQVDPFIITGQTATYEVKNDHYMLVIPVTQLRMTPGKNIHTEEEGYVYTGSFFFPCNTNTKDHKSKENCVTLVAMLEGERIAPEVLTFDLRVCACPGRDGDKIVNKEVEKLKKPKDKLRKRGVSKGCESSLTKQPRVTSSNDSADDELLDTDGNSTGFTNPSPTMPTDVADSTHSGRRSSNLHLATQRRISAASVGIGSPKIQILQWVRETRTRLDQLELIVMAEGGKWERDIEDGDGGEVCAVSDSIMEPDSMKELLSLGQ